MSVEKTGTKTPACPHCGGELQLKKGDYASVKDYFFACSQCAIEYTNERVNDSTNRQSA
jgi:ssDNA-binding Zn-finger/Zn-ribbon topoisomerase 1